MEQEKSMNCTKAQASVMCKKDCPSSDNEESKLATESSCPTESKAQVMRSNIYLLPYLINIYRCKDKTVGVQDCWTV